MVGTDRRAVRNRQPTMRRVRRSRPTISDFLFVITPHELALVSPLLQGQANSTA